MTDWPELRIPVAGPRRRDVVAELKRRGGSDPAISIDASVEAHDIAITTSRVPDGEPIEVHGRLEAGLNGLELHATLATAWEGECRRCLELIREPIEIDVRATFLENGDGADDDDAYTFDGETADVGEVVREELMLALPLTPLCDDECQGADPERFTPAVDVDEAAGDQGEDEIDPRWAALSELSFDED